MKERSQSVPQPKKCHSEHGISNASNCRARAPLCGSQTMRYVEVKDMEIPV